MDQQPPCAFHSSVFWNGNIYRGKVLYRVALVGQIGSLPSLQSSDSRGAASEELHLRHRFQASQHLDGHVPGL